LHDLRGERNGALADGLQLLDTADELLVVGVAYSLNLCFAIGGDVVERVDERRDFGLGVSVSEERDQLVEVVGLG